eukprot:1155180-Pelagomonas_calceolata.AAC.9
MQMWVPSMPRSFTTFGLKLQVVWRGGLLALQPFGSELTVRDDPAQHQPQAPCHSQYMHLKTTTSGE